MTRQIDLNFVQRRPFALSTWSWLGLSVLLVSLAIAIFTWQLYQAKQMLLNELTYKLSRLDAQYKKQPVNIVKVEISAEKKLQVEATVSALITPWNELLLAIEKSDMTDIALLSLEPSSKKKQVLLIGEAKSFQAVLSYINRLEQQPMLEQVYLQKHSVDETDISKPVKFTVIAQWQMFEKN